MQNLNINLSTDASGNLVAKQSYSSQNILHTLKINDFSNLIGVEFLIDVDDQILLNTILVKKDLYNEMYNGEKTVMVFPEDGTFTYYKFIVPKLSYFSTGWISDKNNPKMQTLGYKIYQGEVFYNDGSFRVTDTAVEGSESDIVKGSRQISLKEIWEYQNSHVFSFQKVVFSFCKLQKCLVNLQKRILSNPQNCDKYGAICSDSLSRYNRDFVLNAVYVLDYLTKQERFSEAQDLIDSLQDCSGAICEEVESKSNCNCG